MRSSSSNLSLVAFPNQPLSLSLSFSIARWSFERARELIIGVLSWSQLAQPSGLPLLVRSLLEGSRWAYCGPEKAPTNTCSSDNIRMFAVSLVTTYLPYSKHVLRSDRLLLLLLLLPKSLVSSGTPLSPNRRETSDKQLSCERILVDSQTTNDEDGRVTYSSNNTIKNPLKRSLSLSEPAKGFLWLKPHFKFRL